MLWFAEFTAIVGFSFNLPFLAVFLHHDLGVAHEHELDLWTGIAAGSSGLTMALFSPLWGSVADRYGRKPMLVRAMIGGALSVGLMGLAQNPEQLVLLRLLQGATSGTVAAATALVSAETPRHRVGWSLGILTSAVAFGGAFGPFAGGIAAAFFGLRFVFIAGGVLLLVAAIPVVLMVGETRSKRGAAETRPARRVIGAAQAGTMSALVTLMVAQALMQIAYSSAQQLVVLRLLSILHSGAEAIAGTAFGAAGLASGLAAVTYSSAARRTGYRHLAVGLGVLMAAAIAGAAFTSRASVVVGLVAIVGLLYGAAAPALSSMIGLEAPYEIQGRVFGFSSSSISVGFAFGPFLGGATAAAAGVPTALVITAGFGVAMALVLGVRGREPA